jgi:hypothetical protein
VELAIALTVDGENPIIGDLSLSGGDLVWLDDFALETAQRLTIKFNFFKGEWFLDRRQGTPYYQELLVKEPDRNTARGVFRRIIGSDPGVAEVISLTLSEPDAERQAEVVFSARLKNGATLRSTDHGPFLVRVP